MISYRPLRSVLRFRQVIFAHGGEHLDGDGILFAFVTDSTIETSVVGRDNNLPTGNAIELFESTNNTIVGNVIKKRRKKMRKHKHKKLMARTRQ